ncbi:ABC transporter ATP-binding protein [Pusillimonas sp. ANT_WB101]|uniref:ABC transporter ATP-binding protein n=1 Tax=Pusillimonas sp. ANT_WB101 TaxID=2597356 RepID=UPI0011ECFC79|nr:dipeptide ABC transporter ATP-binding protein [Pusillimonas sp. ANT_WB101]KAA0892989.1 dipeptide ABC transporter ATP-binding protein [Pusillimonas sp. ANT_WB101]
MKPPAHTPLIQVNQAARWFDVSSPWLDRVIHRRPRLQLKAVDGVSFHIDKGETLALVGESGCGKSTIARMLAGLYGLTQGSISFDGQPVQNMSRQQRQAMRRRLQMIFQDPYASLNPRWRVGRIIAEPLATHTRMSKEEQRNKVDELLLQVGLSPGDQSRYPHQFSGGQRQRISIARALALGPDFLVCDEPTSALDVSVQAQVLNLMKDLQRHLGLTYLFISHNLAVVHHVADRIGVMYLGRLVEVATRDELFATPRHPYTRMLLGAIPDLTGAGRTRVPVGGEVPNPLNPPSGCTFHPRCPHANERCRQEAPQMISYSHSQAACHALEEGRL